MVLAIAVLLSVGLFAYAMLVASAKGENRTQEDSAQMEYLRRYRNGKNKKKE